MSRPVLGSRTLKSPAGSRRRERIFLPGQSRHGTARVSATATWSLRVEFLREAPPRNAGAAMKFSGPCRPDRRAGRPGRAVATAADLASAARLGRRAGRPGRAVAIADPAFGPIGRLAAGHGWCLADSEPFGFSWE